MKKYKVEKDFMIDEYRCVILGLSLGHRCGYVGLPQGHECYDMDYDDIEVDVHGGLTYSKLGMPPVNDTSRYWIGFDCCHCDDGKDFSLIKELNDERIYNHYVDMERIFSVGGKVRTLEFVENELVSIVSQLKNIDSNPC